MSTSDRIHFSTIPQVNEGYVADILTSKNASPEVKKELITYLTKQKCPTPMSTTVKTIRRCGCFSVKMLLQSNQSIHGTDKLIDETAKVIPKITPVVADSAVQITKEVRNNY